MPAGLTGEEAPLVLCFVRVRLINTTILDPRLTLLLLLVHQRNTFAAELFGERLCRHRASNFSPLVCK